MKIAMWKTRILLFKMVCYVCGADSIHFSCGNPQLNLFRGERLRNASVSMPRIVLGQQRPGFLSTSFFLTMLTQEKTNNPAPCDPGIAACFRQFAETNEIPSTIEDLNTLFNHYVATDEFAERNEIERSNFSFSFHQLTTALHKINYLLTCKEERKVS